MGILDRAKGWLGIGTSDDASDEAPNAGAAAAARPDKRGEARDRARQIMRKDGRERPPLKEIDVPPAVGVDDVLAARDSGDRDGARKLLRDIDRGGGLRTVLRAAAALEAGDEDELVPLLPTIAREEPAWRLELQIAAALGDPAKAAPWLERASRHGAPAWAVAWSRALSDDEASRREGLVELLFADPALARTVASRDLALPGVASDAGAAQRYASFAHGRDSIRRFGVALVAAVVERAGGGAR